MQKVFHRVASVEEIAPGSGKLVRVGRDECVVFRAEDGGVYAVSALCPHQNEPFDRGRLEGCEVVCRRHHLRFDVRSGECTNAYGYATQVYEVRVEGDDVYVGFWDD